MENRSTVASGNQSTDHAIDKVKWDDIVNWRRLPCGDRKKITQPLTTFPFQYSHCIRFQIVRARIDVKVFASTFAPACTCSYPSLQLLPVAAPRGVGLMEAQFPL